MSNIKYTGYFNTISGMGHACRNYIKALNDAGVSVAADLAPNITTEKNLGEAHDVCQLLYGRDINYKIKIIHTTPDAVTNFLEPMKYHIFHLFWETDKVPQWWVWALNLVDEIWTGSEYNKKAFIDSGVKKPIYVFPQPIENPGEMGTVETNKFTFCSIFQWIERKDPKKLLQAYWKEFRNEKDVCLMIKTYKERFTRGETSEILRNIDSWKKELNFKTYPEVRLCLEELSRDQIWNIHNSGDCFVLPHRGEGWGIPIAEAMMAGNPVISTNLGGIHGHVPLKYWYPIGHEKVNVFNMDFSPWYNSDQMWGNVSERMLRDKMREVFKFRNKAKEKGKKAREFVLENFSYLSVGNRLKERLAEIEINL